MKVGTFNVNSIRSRKDLVIEWLEKRELDIDLLCIQELKGEDGVFPYQDFEEIGYNCTVFGEKQYNGVAICSKVEMEEMVYGFQDPFWDTQKRLLTGRFGPLTIMNLYAPRGDERGSKKFLYKMGWYRKFLDYLTEEFSPEDALIIVGDLNIAYEDLDLYDPVLLEDVVSTMPEERKLLEDLFSWGLVDTFRYLYPEEKAYSWWDYRGGAFWKDQGMRIDYILCTKPLLSKLRKVEMDLWPRKRRKPTPSDHTPVLATFNFDN